MRKFLSVLCLASAFAGACLYAVTAQTTTTQRKDSAKEPGAKAPTPAAASVLAKHAADEAAIRKSGQTYVEAYARGDAQRVAAHFTEDAEYVDEAGEVTHGRAEILSALIDHFRETPGAKLELEIDSIRFIAPGVAVEDGMTRHTEEGAPEPVINEYTAVHVKVDGKWLVASVRDREPVSVPSPAEQLKQLDWLLGDWIDEDPDSVIHFSGKVAKGGNFLIREFRIQIEGEDALTGTQRFGWDAHQSCFRCWTFDSEGGFSEGTFHRDGDLWVLKAVGQTADGEPAQSTTVFTVVNAHTVSAEITDFVLHGEEIPGPGVVTLVRAPAVPRSK